MMKQRLWNALLLCAMSMVSAKQIALVSNFSGVSLIDNVSLIDIVNDTIITTVTTGANPVGIAMTPDAKKAYVVNSGDNTVTVIDLTSFPPTTTTLDDPAFGFNFSAMVAITPDGSKAYVTNSSGMSITVINTSDDSLNTVIQDPLLEQPYAIAITPDGQTALITQVSTVTKIDLATNALSSITSPDFSVCSDIAIKPDGTTAYVTDIENNVVVPIDLTTFTAGTAIPVTSSFLIAINPSGTKAYVTTEDTTVADIDITNNTFSQNISGFNFTGGVAFTPDDNKAYVTDYYGTDQVFPVTVQNGTPQNAINGFQTPFCIAISPDQAPTAQFIFTTAPAGSATIFDASSSFSVDGVIETYAWDFGDGNTAVTSSPTIFHTYTSPGVFTAQLTVMNSQGTSTLQTFTGKTVSNQGGPSAQSSQLLEIDPALSQFVPVPDGGSGGFPRLLLKK